MEIYQICIHKKVEEDDQVHDQAYFTNNQKFIYLMQHVHGEAKRPLQVFLTN